MGDLGDGCAGGGIVFDQGEGVEVRMGRVR